jgi:hypothetical protein
MVQLLIALIVVLALGYFALTSHSGGNAAPEAKQIDQSYEMKQAKQVQQVMDQAAEKKREDIEYQSGQAPSP